MDGEEIDALYIIYTHWWSDIHSHDLKLEIQWFTAADNIQSLWFTAHMNIKIHITTSQALLLVIKKIFNVLMFKAF